MYITISEIDDQCKFDACSRTLKADILGQPRGMVGERGVRGAHNRGTHV